MAITFLGNGTAPADNGSQADNATVVVTPPASMLAGDLVLMIAFQRSVTSGNMTLSQQGGQTWNTLTEHDANSLGVICFWCTFNGTWSANPSIAFGSLPGTVPCSVQMLVARPDNANKTWAVDVAQSFTDFAAPTTPFTVTVNGAATTAANTISFAAWFCSAANTWGTLSGSGWSKTSLTAQYRNASGSGQSATYAYNIQTASGTPANVSQNESAGTAGTKFIIAFSSTQTVQTFNLVAGSATLTGGTAEWIDSLKLVTSALVLSGDAVVLTNGKIISLAAGSLALSGNSAERVDSLGLVSGSLALLGGTLSLSNALTLNLVTGSLTLTGYEVSISRHVRVNSSLNGLGASGQFFVDPLGR